VDADSEWIQVAHQLALNEDAGAAVLTALMDTAERRVP
jgi:hypothetical protein